MAVKQISGLVIFSNVVFITKYCIAGKLKHLPFDLSLSVFVVHNCKFQYLFFFLVYSYVLSCDYNNSLLVFASMVIEILMFIARI